MITRMSITNGNAIGAELAPDPTGYWCRYYEADRALADIESRHRAEIERLKAKQIIDIGEAADRDIRSLKADNTFVRYEPYLDQSFLESEAKMRVAPWGDFVSLAAATDKLRKHVEKIHREVQAEQDVDLAMHRKSAALLQRGAEEIAALKGAAEDMNQKWRKTVCDWAGINDDMDLSAMGLLRRAWGYGR